MDTFFLRLKIFLLGFLICVPLFYSQTLYSEVENPVTLQDIVNSIQTTDQAPSQNTDSAPSFKSSDYQITSFEIIGNQHASTELIKKSALIQVGDEVNPYKIDRIIKNISSLGLFESVTSKIENTQAGKKLEIYIKENALVTEILITGNTVITSDILLQQIQSKKSDLFNTNNIRKDIQTIEEVYQNKGYRWAKVNRVEKPSSDSGALCFYIDEGILDEVIISGNSKTQPYVILREMDLQPGMVLEENLLREDLRRVYNLNFFSELIPDFTITTGNRYALILDLKEKPSGSINFGGGYGNSSGFFGFIDLYLDNLLGTGQLVAIRGQIAEKNNTYEFKYYNPWMFGKHKSFTYQLWRKTGILNNFMGSTDIALDSRDEERTGTSFSIGWPFSYDFRSSHTFKYETVQPKNDGLYRIISYMINLSYDTRDVWFNPLQGDYYYFSVEKGFKLFETATNFTKYDVSLRRFIKTFDRQTIAGRIDFGYMTGELNDKSSYTVGGGSTVRGYSDSTPFATGNKRVLINLEYRFLFNDIFTGLVFIDTGWATNGSDIFVFTKYKVGKGVGMRLNTPIGPFRLDFGIDETGEVNTHFNIGHVF